MFSFGVVSIGTAFVKSFSSLCIARAFLGIAEGGTMPVSPPPPLPRCLQYFRCKYIYVLFQGIAFFLSCFYKRHELLFRIGLFVSSSSLAGAFGGLLATVLT